MTTPEAPEAPEAGRRLTIDPRIRQRRVDILRSQGRRRLRWVVGGVVALVLVAVGLALLHTPWFSAQVVVVSGPHPHTPTASVVAAAGLDGHPPLISVDPGPAARRVEQLPFIATAQVHRHWPDGVTVTVVERVPKVIMAGPGTSWSMLDGHGRTLAVSAARPPGLMVLSVLTARGPIRPAPMGGTITGGGAFALIVSRTVPLAFSAQVVSDTEAANGTVSLGLNSGITVLLGTDSDLMAKYEDVAAVIAHGDLHGTHTIDVTVPQSPTTSP